MIRITAWGIQDGVSHHGTCGSPKVYRRRVRVGIFTFFFGRYAIAQTPGQEKMSVRRARKMGPYPILAEKGGE